MEKRGSKQTLISLLSFIRDCELEKPLREINMGLVEACIKLLLRLQEREVVFTAEQIKERVRKIPFVLTPDFNGEANKKVKKYTTKKKILLVAAIVALLSLLMGIGYSLSEDRSIFEYVADKIGLENVELGKTYTNDGISYQENERIKWYKDINDYPEDNPYDILLPTYLPDSIKVKDLFVSDMNGADKISIGYNTPVFSYTIYLDSKIPQPVTENCEEVITVNKQTVYVIDLPDIGTYQMYFEYNGDYYELCFTDKQELLKVIENLEE